MTIQESSPINPIPERGAPSNAHLGELLAADETVRALRYQQLIGIARDEGLTSGPHRPYKLTSTTEAQCLVYRALFSIPTPIPGSAGKTGPTSGTTVDDRGCVCVKVRAKDATIGVYIEAVTIDGTSTTFGASVLAGASTTTGAYETFDVLSSGITEGVLYPSGVSAGDTIAITVYAYHDNTSGSSEGYVAGIMVEECGITDTTIEPPAPPADVPTATALADFSTLADGAADGDSIIINETGRVMMWSASASMWLPPEIWSSTHTVISRFDGTQTQAAMVTDGWVFDTNNSGTCTVSGSIVEMTDGGVDDVNTRGILYTPTFTGHTSGDNYYCQAVWEMTSRPSPWGTVEWQPLMAVATSVTTGTISSSNALSSVFAESTGQSAYTVGDNVYPKTGAAGDWVSDSIHTQRGTVVFGDEHISEYHALSYTGYRESGGGTTARGGERYYYDLSPIGMAHDGQDGGDDINGATTRFKLGLYNGGGGYVMAIRRMIVVRYS